MPLCSNVTVPKFPPHFMMIPRFRKKERKKNSLRYIRVREYIYAPYTFSRPQSGRRLRNPAGVSPALAGEDAPLFSQGCLRESSRVVSRWLARWQYWFRASIASCSSAASPPSVFYPGSWGSRAACWEAWEDRTLAIARQEATGGRHRHRRRRRRRRLILSR